MGGKHGGIPGVTWVGEAEEERLRGAPKDIKRDWGTLRGS